MNLNEDSLQNLLRQHLDADTSRFDRLEKKIDKLADTVVALARAEEKLISLEKHRANMDEKMEKMSADLDEAWDKLRANETTLNNASKFLWLIIAALVPVLVQVFLK